MARPDKTRNSQVKEEIRVISGAEPTRNTISHEKISTTMVRMAVATSESVFLMPHFARTAVIPAKNAEPTANKPHMAARLPVINFVPIIVRTAYTSKGQKYENG